MPFITPLKLQLLNESSEFPWILLEDYSWQDPDTDEVFTAPKHFRTDGASVPIAIAAIPVIGQALVMKMFATGMFKAFKPGVIHDWARREKDGTRPMPAADAHLLLKRIMEEQGYPEDIVEAYYKAVVTFNS
jgi:hypothetical protein